MMSRWLEALAYTFLWFSIFGWMFGVYFLLEYRDQRRGRYPLLVPISDSQWDRLRAPLSWRIAPRPDQTVRGGDARPAREAEIVLLRPKQATKRRSGQIVAFPHRLSPRREPGTFYKSPRRR